MGWRDDSWRGGIKLYKTHLFLSTMEKVKAHDRYKHICYWVVQLLYFDGLESEISTQVGFVLIRCVSVSFVYFTAQLALGFVNVQWCAVHVQNQKPGVNTTPDPLVVLLQSAVRNRQSYGSPVWGFNIVQWRHTLLRTHKRDAGIIRTSF